MKHSKKILTLLVSLLLLLSVTAGGTIAFLMDTDGPLDNLFKPSQVTTQVEETRDGSIKKDVSIKNTGDTTAWIRAAIVVTWQDKDGNVYGQAPVKDTDYTMELNVANDGWMEGEDGFYYWYQPVKSVEEDMNNCNTGVLIKKCTYKANAPEGYFLTVEIIGSGIQSKPETVFNTEWESSGFQVQGDKIADVE